MSAYQVNEECLYNVLTIISNSYGFGEHYDKAIEVIKMAKDKPAELFDQLARLNIYALTERYNSRMADMVSELKFNEQAYTKARLYQNKYQLLKSLSCYNYQCSEGHAIDEHLHKVCESIFNEQTYNIVDSLPEYKQAKWE